MKATLSRLVTAAVTIGLIGAAALVVAPAPAAAVPGLIQITESGPGGPAPVKTVTARCPEGTFILDGGGFIFGDIEDKVRLTGLRQVTAGGHGFEATAAAASGFRDDWRLSSYAICAPRIGGWTLHRADSGVNQQWWRSVKVECPAGSKVVGAGAKVNGAEQGVALQVVIPTANLDSVNAQAYEVANGITGQWSLTAYAVCVDPIPGMQRVGAFPGPAASHASAQCPGSSQVHGLGGALSGTPGRLFITAMYPAGSLSSATTIGVENQANPPQSTWAPATIAICAP